MELTVIYDNEVLDETSDLLTEHGFSCLIENGAERILFDTGGDGKRLIHNMQQLDIDPSTIDRIVISHEHWDHNGGLKDLFHYLKSAHIYDLIDRDVPQGLTHHMILDGQEISKGIRTTGLIKGEPLDEQSLVIEGKEGLWVMTGCSHPGVGAILDKAGENGNVIGLIGGLHDLKDLTILKDLKHIYPMHCTVRKIEILKQYPDTAVAGGIGTRITI